MKNHIEEAGKGRDVWLRIKNELSIEPDDCLFIFAENNTEFNSVAKGGINSYMKRKYLRKAYIVAEEKTGEMDADITLSSGELSCLLIYYKLYQFKKNIVVFSLSEPFGNSNIVGNKKITLEDLINDAYLI